MVAAGIFYFFSCHTQIKASELNEIFHLETIYNPRFLKPVEFAAIEKMFLRYLDTILK